MASAPPRLHHAVARREGGKIKQFIKAGDDVNARDADGCTALLGAVHTGQSKSVDILLAAGADPSISDNKKYLPLYIAAQNENLAIATALIRAKADINAICDRPDAGTALAVAAFMGHKAMVRLLLDAGCDTSLAAAGGDNPLAAAARHGHTEVVRMLLDAGADVSVVCSDGINALIAGAMKGSCDVIRILLEGGADVDQPDSFGRTALHMAAQEGFDELINVLIGACATVDQADSKKETPLHFCAYFGHSQCAWLLLRAGANVSARDCHGVSPLHVAACKGHTDMIEMLLSAGAQADVNLEVKKHRTPLSSAAGLADAKAVNLLLDAGADINRCDIDGRTAIWQASDLQIVKALLDRGANAKILAKDGATVLHTTGGRGESAGIICALFRAGADPTVKDVRGRTAADLARGAGHEDTAKLLDLLAAKHRSMNST